ncbi:flagellar protein FlaG [Tolumonas lignilytica]|jgi:Uncharacterized flagellar protein FlaG|uniref:flagellar protein FlaG n=1 Tax=Tolumonas lignilytica TaxID=1283284 RepID=UPI000463C445|nr:flagellar protein FlaG [Tolumonas lignilytica]
MSNDLNVNITTSSTLAQSESKSSPRAALSHSEQKVNLNDNNVQTNNAVSGNKPIDKNAVGNHSDQTDKHASSKEMLEQAQKLQKIVQAKGWSLNFSVDKELGDTVVKVVDSSTNKLIRQIPSDDWLFIAKKLHEVMSSDESQQSVQAGLLFNKKV